MSTPYIDPALIQQAARAFLANGLMPRVQTMASIQNAVRSWLQSEHQKVYAMVQRDPSLAHNAAQLVALMNASDQVVNELATLVNGQDEASEQQNRANMAQAAFNADRKGGKSVYGQQETSSYADYGPNQSRSVTGGVVQPVHLSMAARQKREETNVNGLRALAEQDPWRKSLTAQYGEAADNLRNAPGKYQEPWRRQSTGGLTR